MKKTKKEIKALQEIIQKTTDKELITFYKSRLPISYSFKIAKAFNNILLQIVKEELEQRDYKINIYLSKSGKKNIYKIEKRIKCTCKCKKCQKRKEQQNKGIAVSFNEDENME